MNTRSLAGRDHLVAHGGLWLLPVLALLLTPGLSEAKKGKDKGASGSGSLTERARVLRQQGVSAIAAKDYVGAADSLAQAYRVSPDAETLYQLGRLAWASGRTVFAQDLMRRFLADPTVPALPSGT